MKLLSVKIDGFRNLKDIHVSFSDMCALVSTNDYGKSNLLDAIKFTTDFMLESRDSKRKMMADMSCMPYNINHHPDVFSAELLLAVDFDGLECIVEYHFAFEWRYEEEYKIVSESLKIKQDRSKKFTTLINRDESSAQDKASDAARCNSKISVDDYELILNKLQAYEDLYYHSIICKLNNIEIYVDRYLDASSSYQPDPFIRKDFNELDLESLHNLPRILFFLSKQYPDEYHRLEDAYMQLFPNIIEIQIRELELNAPMISEPTDDFSHVIADKIYLMRFKDKNLHRLLDMDSLSGGAKRAFVLLTRCVIADIRQMPLLAFEELENCVHPSLLKMLLSIIKQLTNDDCNILLASHSPYLVSYLNPQDIYVGLPNDEGIAEFLCINNGKKLLIDAYESNCSIGDLLFDLMSSDHDNLLKYLGRNKAGLN